MPRGRRSGYNDDQQLSFDALWAEPEPARDEQVGPHGDTALGEDRPGPLPADPRVARGYGCPRCAVSRCAGARAGTFARCAALRAGMSGRRHQAVRRRAWLSALRAGSPRGFAPARLA